MTTTEQYPGLDYFHEQPEQEAIQTLTTYFDAPWLGCDEAKLHKACVEVYAHVAERGCQLHDWKHMMSNEEYKDIKDDQVFELHDKAHKLLGKIDKRSPGRKW